MVINLSRGIEKTCATAKKTVFLDQYFRKHVNQASIVLKMREKMDL